MAPLQEDNGNCFITANWRNVEPVIIGLCGAAGTGKTSVADTLVPQSLVVETENEIWDQKVLASPLYAMATIRRDIQGSGARDRQMHELHQVLFDLFGRSPLYGLPPYDILVDFVYDIMDVPIPQEGKPRAFLQEVGSMCRAIDKNCFVSFMRRQIIKDAMWAVEQDKRYFCIVSDIRMPNEAEMISSFKGGVVVKFTASDAVRQKRLMARDGFLLTEAQANHESERIDDIPEEFITATIDTNELSIEEQAKATKNQVLNLVGV